uniref:Carboxypeptidase n=1 Tax=Kalanchoe fedtschenkoi TaxID=63787 RepID=A0A7N0UCR6_KALFE
MTGNFFELGPWRINPQTQDTQHPVLEPNPGSWNAIFGLLFLDNPIGTGFSIAATPESIPRDQETVAEHLHAAITKFVGLDPVFKSRPVYITGESYAGKYIPAIGSYILKMNALLSDSRRVNLGGVAIGNGLTDPATQVATHAVNAYFSGFINERQKAQLERAQLEAIDLVKKQNWSAATDARNRVLHMLTNMTGLATLYDFTRRAPYETGLVTQFLKSNETKQLLKANATIDWEECSGLVGDMLHPDVMKSVKDKVEYMLTKTRVLLYQGHRDLRDGVVSVEAWVKTMNWGEMSNYLAAERRVWKVDGKLAGYVQKWDKLSQVVILGAGHLVPTDQGLNSQAMIEDWVLQRGLFSPTNIQSEPISTH